MKKLIALVLGITLAYSCSTNSDGNGNSTTTVVPVAPSNLTGIIANSTQINLTWTDNSTNETGFKIERKTGTGTYTIVGTTASDVTTFSDTGLNPISTYTYRIYSFNAGGNSPTYSNELTLTIFPNVTIGTQIWSSSNLDVTTYRDGTPIPQVADPTQWTNLTTGAWCHYNNESANGTTYGKLYNWYAVAGIHDNDPNTPNKILAPQGWHIPTDVEWTTLINYLGGELLAGGKMKSTGTIQAGSGLWASPNAAATNESGFSGLPAGYRQSNAFFNNIGSYCYWWSFSEYQTTHAWCRFLSSHNGKASPAIYYKTVGNSVRCIKD
ncbi:FISUMP domain-containing protein [Flavobacterium sp.]|uniref:FISUMP domain-containing protein n=1 Tax=Flavobacterium sp. TaxID=239 RepID=UPI0033417C25